MCVFLISSIPSCHRELEEFPVVGADPVMPFA